MVAHITTVHIVGLHITHGELDYYHAQGESLWITTVHMVGLHRLLQYTWGIR